MTQAQRALSLALLVSLVLHGWLLSRTISWRLPTWREAMAFSIDLRHVQPKPLPKPVPALLPQPESRPVPRQVPRLAGAASRPADMQPSSPAATPQPAPQSPPAAASSNDFFTQPEPHSLHDRALAATHEVEQQRRKDEARGSWMIKPKDLPPSLAKLPPEQLTALAQSFEDHLAELVILSSDAHQEGNYRVTVIQSNKGRLCYYEPLVPKYYLRGAPEAPQLGTCGPKS